jgi:hypothetical protein
VVGVEGQAAAQQGVLAVEMVHCQVLQAAPVVAAMMYQAMEVVGWSMVLQVQV